MLPLFVQFLVFWLTFTLSQMPHWSTDEQKGQKPSATYVQSGAM